MLMQLIVPVLTTDPVVMPTSLMAQVSANADGVPPQRRNAATENNGSNRRSPPACSPPFLPTHCIRRSLPTPHHLNWRSLAERTGEHREEVTICATFLRNCCGNGTAVA